MEQTKFPLLLLNLQTLITGVAVAQDTASLTGTVRDSSGGVIVRAEVTIRNDRKLMAASVFPRVSARAPRSSQILSSHLAGALICAYVWMSLTEKAKLVGFAWLGLGVVYLAFLTQRFHTRPKQLEMPSELS